MRLSDARARIKLLEDLSNGATLVNTKISAVFTGDERRLTKLILDAAFFVTVRHIDGFRDFLATMRTADVRGRRPRKGRGVGSRHPKVKGQRPSEG